VNNFRSLILLCALGAAASSAFAHDVAPKTEGDVTFATIDGMQVLIKRIPGAEMESTNLYIRGGARNWGKDDAGVEAVALAAAASGGAGSLDKVAFGRRLSELGSNIYSYTDSDWSLIASKGLARNFDATFGLVADIFLRPAMPKANNELMRQQQLVFLQRRQEQPEGRLQVLVNDTLFAGQPYDNPAEGTMESVKALTDEQLNAHLAKLRDGSRLLLVVVGDVDPAHVLTLARSAYGSLPHGHYKETPMPHPAFTAPRLVTEKRDLPTNYLQGWFVSPSFGAPDYAASRVAMGYMWDQLFKEVRTKRNLSYAPGAGVSVYQAGSLGMVSVSAVDPTTTYKVMLDELRRLQSTPLTAAQLAGAKATYLTGVINDAEATDGQANLLATGALLGNDWRYAGKFPDQLRAVTAADVQAFSKKYIVNLQTVMLGDPAKLDPALGKSL